MTQKEGNMNRLDNIEVTEDRLLETLGAEEFLLSLQKAMSVDEKESLYAYICRCWDIPTECQE